MKKVVIFLFLFLSTGSLSAQYKSQIISGNKILKRFKSKDSLSVIYSLSDYLSKIRQKGYIASSFDSIVFDSLQVKAYLFGGKKYYWKKIEISSPYYENNFIHFYNKAINFRLFDTQIKNIQNDFLNTGYPFVSVSFDSLKISKNKISTKININKGRFISFDSIYFDDKNIKISRNFLSNYLDFKKENPYCEEKVKKIYRKLKRLPFLEIHSKPEIEFHKTGADLYLYLKQKKINQISGIVGFTNVNDKFILLGQADVKLVNTLQRADEIRLRWKKTKEKSQNLNLYFSVPYIFNTKIGFNNSLIIRKIDTSFVNFSNKFSLSYFFQGMDNVGTFFHFQRSIVLDSTSLYQNYYISSYGINLNFSNTDNIFNPHKGIILKFSASLGKKNNYDSIVVNYSFKNDFSIYLPFANKFVIHLRNFFFYFKSKDIYENELFKFGGTSLMRGFDEESLSANFVDISTFELRYMLDNLSNIFIFSDYGIFKHLTINANYWQHPISCGFGVNISTKAAIISLTYAIGKLDNEPFILKDSKIHVGYKTFF